MASKRAVKIDVAGLSDLGRTMLELKDNVSLRLIRKAVKAGSEVVVEAAKAKAPVKTGKMRDSIGSRRDGRESKPGVEVRAVSIFRVKGQKYTNNASNRQKGRVGKTFTVDPPTFYWKFIEFGNSARNIAARPFLRPAFDSTKEQQITKVKEVLTEGIFKAQKAAARKAAKK